MENKKTILMIANSDTAANGFLSLAERLQGRKEIRFVMVCHPRVHIKVAEEKIQKMGINRFSLIDFDKKAGGADGKRIGREYQYKRDSLLISLGKAVVNTCRMVIGNSRGKHCALDIIKRERPRVILLYADNKSELEKFFIYYAKKQKIKTVIAPICFASIASILSNPTNGFRLKKGEPLPVSAKIVRRISPCSERCSEDERVFFRQPFTEIMDRLMGFYVPNPWVQGSLADMVCTAYPKQYDEIERELGRDSAEGRLFLTESVEDGIIIDGYHNRQQIRKHLSEKYGLYGKKTVVIAFSERLQQWSRENDLYNKGLIVQSVLEYYDETLVSLHPKSNLDENRFLEKYEGCYIAEEPLRSIIGAADVVIYANRSSVARWVEWLQIDSVIYPSFSMQDKWTEDMAREFKEKLALSVKPESERLLPELERRVDFADFLLDLL
ncbi:MAG: hypothetical protein K2I53_15635 [Lachnospiraceae bacterium]|nr:hypothetical protein [Lachnospiraceae bacterium]